MLMYACCLYVYTIVRQGPLGWARMNETNMLDYARYRMRIWYFGECTKFCAYDFKFKILQTVMVGRGRARLDYITSTGDFHTI